MSTDPKEQDDILDVVRASSVLSLESLKPAEFMELVTTALNHLCTRQEEGVKKGRRGESKTFS